MEKLYTISEVADKLGLSTKTLRRWEESGKFTGTRTLGGQRRYSLTDLQVLDAIKHGVVTGSDDLLTIEQAAQLFGVTTTTIARWEDEGKIHPLITSGITYYPRHRLLSKLDELKPTEPFPDPVPVAPPTIYREPIRPTPIPPPVEQPIYQPSAPRRTLKPLTSYTPSFKPDRWLFPLNVVVTLLLISLYHIFITQAQVPTTPSTQQGAVKGETTSRDASLALLDSILDISGNIKPKSLTTSVITLTPSSPSIASPGSLYFDASTQTVKVYNSSGWKDLSAGTVQADGAKIQTGTAILSKGKAEALIEDGAITQDSVVTLTFTSDFAAAKKFWVTVRDGSFTLHTDFPVSQSTQVMYLIVN